MTTGVEGRAGLGRVGFVANPASGKDVRRLVARASVFNNQEKRAILRRAMVGAITAGATEFLLVPDSHGIASSAAEEFTKQVKVTLLDGPQTGSVIDTVRGARALRELGCGAVITLGGDGTNRAFVSGWPDVTLMPISTGTNNVFPRLVEGTVAGAAAGLVASGRVPHELAAARVKAVRVRIPDQADDLALIDAAVVDGEFIGARALWEAGRLRLALLTRAEPASVGVSSIGGLLSPISDTDDAALLLMLGDLSGHGEGAVTVMAPIAPGSYSPVQVGAHRRLALGEEIEVQGPCVLAFDGERERVLRVGQSAFLRVERDGPFVIDATRALNVAAARGLFTQQSGGSDAR